MWGAQQPLEFAWVDPGHGRETVRPVAALEETDLLERPVSPSKTTWPFLGLQSFMAGTLPALSTTTRASGGGSVAAAGFLFVQTVPGFFTPPIPGLQVRENHCLGFKASSQGALQDGGAMAG